MDTASRILQQVRSELKGKMQPSPDQKLPLKQTLIQLLHNKTVLLAIGMFLVISAGAYIMVSPSFDKKSVVPAPSIIPPTVTPTTTPVPTAAATATPLPNATAVPPTATPTIIPTPTLPPPTSWKTYSNTVYGYSIKYSPDWIVINHGELEPKIPSYVIFNPSSAAISKRAITIGVTTRTYDEQLAMGASSSATKVAGITGSKQYFQDSDGNVSTVVVLPRTNNLLVLRAKKDYYSYFEFMLSTLTVKK